jgi:thiol:disulfide interchange protein DsbC
MNALISTSPRPCPCPSPRLLSAAGLFKRSTGWLRCAAAVVLALAAAAPALAQEALIRKNLAERIPAMPKIDEVRSTPVAGIFEVRYGGTEIFYSDATGDHIFVEGAMLATATMTNLTEARLDKLNAIDFASLPLKDAIAVKQGNGSRKMAVFADPNCGFCKRFERDLAGIKDVTIYTFLIPILGADSTAKSRDIWCAADSAQAWRGWMLDGKMPTKAAAKCDSAAIERNLAVSKQYRINGTPAVVFEDGTRRPGAIPADMVERLLAAAAKKP